MRIAGRAATRDRRGRTRVRTVEDIVSLYSMELASGLADAITMALSSGERAGENVVVIKIGNDGKRMTSGQGLEKAGVDWLCAGVLPWHSSTRRTIPGSATARDPGHSAPTRIL